MVQRWQLPKLFLALLQQHLYAKVMDSFIKSSACASVIPVATKPVLLA